MSKFSFRFIMVLLVGLAWMGQAAAKPDEVSESAVKDCRFLGKVAGHSGFGKNLGWQALAKGTAERIAGKMGATHIVFTDYRGTGSFNGEASGKAYICQ